MIFVMKVPMSKLACNVLTKFIMCWAWLIKRKVDKIKNKSFESQ